MYGHGKCSLLRAGGIVWAHGLLLLLLLIESSASIIQNPLLNIQGWNMKAAPKTA